tara:strand:+ start:1039 stop:2229 length:1191 start_codon:yes stop_codon:yes gene_type:complete
VIKDLIKIFLFFLIKLIPKKRNVLVFGDRAGRRFADNSRHLFIYLNENHKEFKCVWISKNKILINYLNHKKFIAYHSNSMTGLYYSLIANYHLYNFVEDDIHKIITEFSKSILLWHGVLPKKLKAINFTTSYISHYINKKNNKYFVYPNKKMANNITDRFPKDKYKLLISNLPRNIIFQKDNLLKSKIRTDSEIKFINDLKKEKKTIFGYFPTWRSDGMELFIDVKNLDDLKKTNEILKKNNSVILIKKHMNSDINDKNILYNNNIEKISDYISKLDSFRFISYDFDLNSILDSCNVLITDYSGVMFDFLYLDRPIILYLPDYYSFKKNNGFVFDPVEKNFSHVAFNLKQLNENINEYFKNNLNYSYKYKIQRRNIKKIIFLQKENIQPIINLLKD